MAQGKRAGKSYPLFHGGKVEFPGGKVKTIKKLSTRFVEKSVDIHIIPPLSTKKEWKKGVFHESEGYGQKKLSTVSPQAGGENFDSDKRREKKSAKREPREDNDGRNGVKHSEKVCCREFFQKPCDFTKSIVYW
ncbi:MAG: hypothetical protein ACI4U2_04720 [Christensenellaceae bacterium]